MLKSGRRTTLGNNQQDIGSCSGGNRLNSIDTAPNASTDTDLATGLSRAYRRGGHSCWGLPLSVAQHSLTVLAIRRQLAPTPLTAGEALIGGFDPIIPLKPHLGEG